MQVPKTGAMACAFVVEASATPHVTAIVLSSLALARRSSFDLILNGSAGAIPHTAAARWPGVHTAAEMSQYARLVTWGNSSVAVDDVGHLCRHRALNPNPKTGDGLNESYSADVRHLPATVYAIADIDSDTSATVWDTLTPRAKSYVAHRAWIYNTVMHTPYHFTAVHQK